MSIGFAFASAGTRLTDPQATVLDAENGIRRQDRCLAVPVRWLLCEFRSKYSFYAVV
jgi:hypothetical protein